MPHQNQSETKRRVSKVFHFLKELENVRNPVALDMLNYKKRTPSLLKWPSHPCVQIRNLASIEASDDDTGIPPIITIKRPQITKCPEPPREIEGWLNPGWQNIELEPSYLPTRNFENENKETITVDFNDDPARRHAFIEWLKTRLVWMEAERPSLLVLRLFHSIQELWSDLQRDSDRAELVLTSGMLSVTERNILHPLISQRISLNFNPAIPEFSFTVGTDKIELNKALLRAIPEVQSRMIVHFEKDIEVNPIDLPFGVGVKEFLKRLIQGLFENGEYLETVPKEYPGHPCLWHDPIILLRPKSFGLTTTIDNIIEDIKNEAVSISEGIVRIVGIDESKSESEKQGDNSEGLLNGSSYSTASTHPDVLFSKPANEEQYQIANRLAQSKSVLVQGPPGTGKTHTIANLLGHLLAQGKTVLVTAHTQKALRVLKQQVDPALQPLCLSLLGGDADSQAELCRSAQAIAARVSAIDAPTLRRHAAELRSKRSQCLQKADVLRRKLRDARFSEVEEIVFNGAGISPIEAAKRVKTDEVHHKWLPGPLAEGAICPLNDTELRELFKTNDLIDVADEPQLAIIHPNYERLISPSDFNVLAQEQAGANVGAKNHRVELWTAGSGKIPSSDISNLGQNLQAAANILGEKQKWLKEALFAGWSGGEQRKTWEDFNSFIQTKVDEIHANQRVVSEFGPRFLDLAITQEHNDTLEKIIQHLESGKPLGLKTKVFHKDWYQLLDQCRVEDRAPKTIEEFKSLSALARLMLAREKMLSRWRRIIQDLEGPSIEALGEFPERSAVAYCQEIHNRLVWKAEVWEPLVKQLVTIGFAWDAWISSIPLLPGDYGELERIRTAVTGGLSEVVASKAASVRMSELIEQLQEQKIYLASFPLSEMAELLLKSQHEWDTALYEESYGELARISGLIGTYTRRNNLLSSLESVAPNWATAIRRREKPHDKSLPAGEVQSAWCWQQWKQTLEKRHSVSISDLQSQLSDAENHQQELAVKIIENEAWAKQKERTTLKIQQALNGFVQIISKLGKRTGNKEKIHELLKAAREALSDAKSAVPVWIMPLTKVYESFDPRDTRFDVVIIDEASQSDVTALAALYLGREQIVVGDKEQVTPDAIGQQTAQIQSLITTSLDGIPNNRLYDGETSIYDLAEMAFGGVVALKEHFRCVPEIIQFSNHLSYANSIRPLREPFAASVFPALVPHRVSGHRNESGKINEIEAEETCSLIMACISDEKFSTNEFKQPTTFGVISLLGNEQARKIEELLRRKLPAGLYEKHRILCGNPAEFQGDERDIVFISMVDDPPQDGTLALREDGPRKMYKKRYNVAVSRARNQLWVVHSVDPEQHLKSGDLRRRLIEHARAPQALMTAIMEQSARTESPFEREVLQRILAAGYKVKTQWQVGAYRIDMVVEGKRKRLAVECDGERWHTNDDLQKDLQRQAILERLGWIFVRIRGSEFYRDPDKALVPVFDKLRFLEIEPLGVNSIENADISVNDDVERIKRKAQALRQKWQTATEIEEFLEQAAE